MGLGPPRGQTAEHFRDASGVGIGKGDADLTFARLRAFGLEHGAGQHQDTSFCHQPFAQRVRCVREGVFNIGEIGPAAQKLTIGTGRDCHYNTSAASEELQSDNRSRARMTH